MPRMSLTLRLLVVLSLSFGAARPQSRQSKETQKRADDEEVVTVRSHLVNVDVSVKDKKGNYVNDLRADDFTVFENGVRQKVEFFNPPLAGGAGAGVESAAKTAREKPQPVAAQSPTRAQEGPMTGNVISLVLDGLTTDPSNMKRVRDGAVKYIREQVADTDSVVLFSVTGGLQLLQPFTHDKDKLIAAVDRASAVSTSSKNFEQRDIEENIAKLREASVGADTADVTSITSQGGAEQLMAAMIAARVLQEYLRLRTALGLQQARPILAALAAICEAQRSIPGKKTLVLFSQGFVTPEVLDWQVQSAVDIANRANVAIYIIDSAGLKASAPQSGAYAPPSPLQGIAAVGRPETQVIARAGYYAIAPDQIVPLSPEEKKLLANVTSPDSNSTLPLFVEMSPFRSQGGRYVVPLALEVPHDAVQFEPKADRRRMQLDVLVVVREGQNNIVSRLGGSFDVLLTAEQYQSVLNNNVFYRQDMELAPGAYNVDMVVRDRISGKTAARREKLVLPETDAEFSMTDAVLSRHVEPARSAPAGSPGDVLSHAGALISPLPSREFSAADNLIIFFDLYNAGVDAATGKPLAKVTVTVTRDGKAAP